MDIYYNYIYLDPRKKGKYAYETICFLYEPIYVGKGKGDRYLSHLKNKKRIDNKKFINKINKIKESIYNIEDYIILLNYTHDESIAYETETKLIEEIGANSINEIKDGTLCNVCLYNNPPNHKGKTYKEIYGDNWIKETEKRREIQIKHGGYFKNKKHSEESKLKITNSLIGENNPMWGKKHKEETLLKQRNVKIGLFDGKLNPNKKIFKFISPNDEIYLVEGEFKKFCKENNLSVSTMRKTLKTKKRVRNGRTKGWICELLT